MPFPFSNRNNFQQFLSYKDVQPLIGRALVSAAHMSGALNGRAGAGVQSILKPASGSAHKNARAQIHAHFLRSSYNQK